MPVTIEEIAKHLKALQITPTFHEFNSNVCSAAFATDSYLDPSGDKQAVLCLGVSEDGKVLDAYVPRAIDATGCKHKAALFAALLWISYTTKYVQFEYDPEDGEIRLMIELPVCDAKITKLQVEIVITVLLNVLNEYYPVFRHAMDSGKVDMIRRWLPNAAASEAEAQAAEDSTTAE
ncbi:MAG: hypothetical protein ACO3QC_11045, partial [Phycisphaerales bacterium]